LPSEVTFVRNGSMALRITNTATRKKEEFVPIKSNEVTMYVCGPTVYDLLHIGNFRGPIFFNLVRNWLEESGYKVTYVYNYTDVDDKIIDRANKDSRDAAEVAEHFIAEFEKDFAQLKLRKHDLNPRVTQHIDAIIEMIEKLIENGNAYVAEGEVLYSVRSFDGYGKLSGKSIDDLRSGSRVEIGSYKKDPLDFSLWKPAKPGEPKWSSPWGDGRPGWHIECSAMSKALLGETIDIHGGGIDLIFPHHENEIAQSEGCTHKPFVRYWMHNNFINFAQMKMSKSLGNIITARGFMHRYHPEILKLMILQSHYRSPADASEAQIKNCISALARVYSALCLAESVFARDSGEQGPPLKKLETLAPKSEGSKAYKATLIEFTGKIKEALDDDFNTPEVLARIFEATRLFNSKFRRGQKVTDETREISELYSLFVRGHGERMALYQEPSREFLSILDDKLLETMSLQRSQIDELVERRRVARLEKNFKESDTLRDELARLGIAVHDSPEGTHWEVQK